jgi:ABC-type Mn2+/Zn2+ transport system permease subunit
MISLFNLFFLKTIVSGIIISTLCSLLSPIVIMRGAGYLTHSLSHIDILSRVFTTIFYTEVFLSRLLFNLLFVTIFSLIEKYQYNNRTILVSLMTNICISVALLLTKFILENNTQIIIESFFPSIFSISFNKLFFLLVILIIFLVILKLFYHELLISSIDKNGATLLNISIQKNNIIFYTLLACAMTLSSELVGSFLSFTLLIAPGSIALNIFDKVEDVFFASCSIANIATLFSIIISFYCDLSINIIITIFISLFYIASVIYKYRYLRFSINSLK